MRERVELYASSLADAAPASVQPFARKAVPILGQVSPTLPAPSGVTQILMRCAPMPMRIVL